ncbi:hypothetical protein KOEU_39180 [Komagataeibacter europaeus]|uniref:Uncharacterized protein n=1 Tax=Komagataeibacter europaeus TaxID=33995 RepID=A0A0M0EBG9_KOMEU|nr:DUF2612 domain-containing protein [Komagataeibacter europaeus]KON62599.1 hypothetical protein KOEU_39180 [Komagataeibacter europaeus]
MSVINTTADSTLLTADSTLLRVDYDPYALAYAGATPTVDAYIGKITPWQASDKKPKFRATVSAGVQPYVDQQAFVASLPAAFDIDFAIGAQLDVVGEWVGRSRFVSVPIPGAFFSWDTDNLGWDQGLWRGPYDGADGITELPDDLFRKLLYAKRASNAWDGTADGAEAVLRIFLNDPATRVFIDDDGRSVAASIYFAFDVDGAGWDQGAWQVPVSNPYQPDRLTLQYTVCVAGRLPPAIELRVLGNGLIPIKSAGVKVDYAVTTVDGAPLFGFDMDDENVGGWDIGAWGADPNTVADLIS